MYGGQCHGIYMKSMIDMTIACSNYGIYMQTFFMFNESLITRARNYCADAFLRSDCTHLLFIDSDIGFTSHDALTLLALQSDDSPYDVLAGLYPKKDISWEKIKLAVDKGFADTNPNELERFVGDYVVNFIEKNETISLGEPAKVAETGTGFMMIRRQTFEKFAEAYPDLKYRPDHARSEHFDGSREIGSYFDTAIIDGRYMSEDYYFCRKIRDAGMEVHVAPWMRLTHAGSYMFSGDLPAIASVGAAVTSDVKVPKK
jgi:hypothetical protein